MVHDIRLTDNFRTNRDPITADIDTVDGDAVTAQQLVVLATEPSYQYRGQSIDGTVITRLASSIRENVERLDGVTTPTVTVVDFDRDNNEIRVAIDTDIGATETTITL